MISVTNHGALSVIRPSDAKARDAMVEVLDFHPLQWYEGGLLVETDFLPAILAALDPHVRIQGRGGSIISVGGETHGSRRRGSNDKGKGEASS